MKYVILLAIVFPLMSNAQSFQISFKAEQTVKGPNFEIGPAYELKKQFGFGLFYQRSNTEYNDDGLSNFASLYGLTLYLPLYASEKVSIRGMLRGGLVSDRFLVLIPAVETRWMILRRAGLTVSTGYRYGFPSGGIGLVYKINLRE